MAIVAPGPGPAPGAGDGLQPRRSGWTPASRRPATGCPTSRSTWAPGRCTRSSPRPRRWRRAWASTTRWPCRRRGYASPIYVDGNGRPIPVHNAGNYAEQLSVHRRAGAVAEHRVHQARGVHRGPGRGGHGGAAGHEVAGHHPVRRPEHRAAHRPVDRRGHQGPEAGLVHPRGEPDQRAGAGQRRAPRWPARASGARPARSSRSPTPNGKPVPVTEAPCDQAVEPGLANTLLTALSKDDQPGGTAAGAAAAGGLEPADGGQDRHHPAAQVRGVRRGRAADGRRGDHVRQLQRAPARCATAPGPRSRAGTGNIFGGKTPARDLVRGDEAAAGRPAGAAAAADRPPLHRGRRRVARSPTSSAAARTTPARSCERAGWKVSTRTVDNRADRGTVVGQNPNGTALPGETILLQISSGDVPPPPPPPGSPSSGG